MALPQAAAAAPLGAPPACCRLLLLGAATCTTRRSKLADQPAKHVPVTKLLQEDESDEAVEAEEVRAHEAAVQRQVEDLLDRWATLAPAFRHAVLAFSAIAKAGCRQSSRMMQGRGTPAARFNADAARDMPAPTCSCGTL